MTLPLRIVGQHGNDPRLDLRTVTDLTPAELFDLVAERFGIGLETGEVTIELVFRHGRFARGHKHETFTASEMEGESPA